jgi:hypothetical protein
LKSNKIKSEDTKKKLPYGVTFSAVAAKTDTARDFARITAAASSSKYNPNADGYSPYNNFSANDHSNDNDLGTSTGTWDFGNNFNGADSDDAEIGEFTMDLLHDEATMDGLLPAPTSAATLGVVGLINAMAGKRRKNGAKSAASVLTSAESISRAKISTRLPNLCRRKP